MMDLNLLDRSEMIKAFTKRQKEILDFIETFIKERGYPPTIREIGKAVGIGSTNGVVSILDALERKKYIMRHRYLSRGIELVNVPKVIHDDKGVSHIPIIGNLTTGKPMFAPENITGTLAVDDSFITANNAFALKVHDDSMSGAGIIKDDYVIVLRQNIGEPGDIVLFIIGDIVRIRLYNEKGYTAILIPENESYETMTIWKNSPDLQIAGKVIGIMRKY